MKPGVISACILTALLYIFPYPAFAQEIIPSDRRIDWTYAGIPGGIPQRTTICKTIDAATYGNGITDATSVIQNALNTCPDDQVVYLPEGTYLINGTVSLPSHKILRGAGPGKTILKRSGNASDPIIHIRTTYGLYLDIYGDPTSSPPIVPIIHTIVLAVKDTKEIMLDNTTGINSGDILVLNQLNDGNDVTSEGTDGTCTFCGLGNGKRSLGQMVEVDTITGNLVSLKQPLHFTFAASLSPLAYRVNRNSMVRWAGLENFTLTQESPAANDLISTEGMQYSWIQNVELENIYVDAIFSYYALQNEIRDNFVHTPINGFGNSAAYGISFTYYSSNNIIQNNILHQMGGDALEEHGGASGNVWAYNYLHDIFYSQANWSISSPNLNHGAHPKMNLWEGNIGYQTEGDFVHGSESHNTIYRAYSKGWQNDTILMNNGAIRLAAKNRYMNIVGSILGTAGKSNTYEFKAGAGQSYNGNNKYIWVLGHSSTGGTDDPDVPATVFRHGNFDYVTNSTIWDPNIPNHTLLPSLYLSQKPSWWCAETPWPPIGPDVPNLVNPIPAQRRFEGLPCTQGTEPSAGLAVWKTEYLTPGTRADFDKNGIVDGKDYVFWLNNYAK